MNNTLGYHRKMAAVVLGEDSRAVKYLDKKIEEHTTETKSGSDEKVLISEEQMVLLLFQVHNGTGSV